MQSEKTKSIVLLSLVCLFIVSLFTVFGDEQAVRQKYKQDTDKVSSFWKDNRGKDIVEAINFIYTHKTEPISVVDVATIVTSTRRTLERKFKRIIGRTINSEIERIRCEHICKMLIETNYSIAHISDKLGFTSIDHISRYFKRIKNITPRSYRKNTRTKLSVVNRQSTPF